MISRRKENLDNLGSHCPISGSVDVYSTYSGMRIYRHFTQPRELKMSGMVAFPEAGGNSAMDEVPLCLK